MRNSKREYSQGKVEEEEETKASHGQRYLLKAGKAREGAEDREGA